MDVAQAMVAERSLPVIASNLGPAERSEDDSMASATADLPRICMMRDPYTN